MIDLVRIPDVRLSGNPYWRIQSGWASKRKAGFDYSADWERQGQTRYWLRGEFPRYTFYRRYVERLSL